VVFRGTRAHKRQTLCYQQRACLTGVFAGRMVLRSRRLGLLFHERTTCRELIRRHAFSHATIPVIAATPEVMFRSFNFLII